MAKESLDDLRFRLKERLNDLRAIHRIVQDDEAFAAAYESASPKEANQMRDAIDGIKREDLQKLMKKWKSRNSSIEEMKVVDLRDLARTTYFIRDKQIREAEAMGGKAALISLIERTIEQANRNK